MVVMIVMIVMSTYPHHTMNSVECRNLHHLTHSITMQDYHSHHITALPEYYHTTVLHQKTSLPHLASLPYLVHQEPPRNHNHNSPSKVRDPVPSSISSFVSKLSGSGGARVCHSRAVGEPPVILCFRIVVVVAVVGGCLVAVVGPVSQSRLA